MASLTQSDLKRLFDLLNEELRRSDTEAELFLVGGAVMCLAYAARPSTQDVHAVFRPAVKVREAAARVAARAGLSPDWLSDGVKEFVSAHGDFAQFLELDHLRALMRSRSSRNIILWIDSLRRRSMRSRNCCRRTRYDGCGLPARLCLE